MSNVIKIGKQEVWFWKGLDKKNTQRQGILTACHRTLVKSELRKQGITPYDIRRVSRPIKPVMEKEISGQDIANFSRNLSDQLKSGASLFWTLNKILDDLQNKHMKILVTDLLTHVIRGESLSSAMEKHPIYFDEFHINLIKVGESYDVLDGMLDIVATYRERIETIQEVIRQSILLGHKE